MKQNDILMLFDWGGIIEPFEQWDDAWELIAKMYNKDNWRELCGFFYSNNYEFETTRNKTITDNIIREFLKNNGLPYTDKDICTFIRLYNKVFKHLVYRKDLVEYIKNELKPYFSTGIFSNISILDAVRQSKQTYNYTIFDYKYLSCDIGEMKPYEKIYQVVVQTFKPSNIYFVDDNIINCKQAQNRGWNVICTNDEKQIFSFFENIKQNLKK